MYTLLKAERDKLKQPEVVTDVLLNVSQAFLLRACNSALSLAIYLN